MRTGHARVPRDVAAVGSRRGSTAPNTSPPACWPSTARTAAPAGFAVSEAARTLLGTFRLVEAWLTAYATASGEQPDEGVLAEAAAVELCRDLERYEVAAPTTATVTGLLGSHPRVKGRALELRLDEFLDRTRAFAEPDVPAFRAYQRQRADLVAAERTRLRLDGYRPRVMSSFVRNRLVDEVYLPLIVDNLAKQLGAAGDAKRSDPQGLLLLLSRPATARPPARRALSRSASSRTPSPLTRSSRRWPAATGPTWSCISSLPARPSWASPRSTSPRPPAPTRPARNRPSGSRARTAP